MIRTILAAIALAMSGLAATCPAGAQTPATDASDERTPLARRADDVVAVINGEIEPEAVFTSAFLAEVSAEQLMAIARQITGQFGPALAVESLDPATGTQAAMVIRVERALAQGSIAIAPGEDNRISGLRFTGFTPVDDSLAKIEANLAALPGTVSAWFGPVGGPARISLAPDRPLAVGSTFKLYVLAALAEDVKAGRSKWSDVVPLTERSFPSGQMQNWPEGAPVTLHTLASLMISISDNTATDQLIAELGEERILNLINDSGHSAPETNQPFLATRELFLLKAAPDHMAESWRSGDLSTRYSVRRAVSLRKSPTLDQINAAFADGPKALDIEWFASPADLARLFAHMRKTADPGVFAIMAINPSATPAIKDNWQYIGFKGGSEPGVLNYTWLLTDKAGRDWVLTLGWNNPAAVLDESKMESIAQRILLLPH